MMPVDIPQLKEAREQITISSPFHLARAGVNRKVVEDAIEAVVEAATWRGCLEHGKSVCWKGDRCEYAAHNPVTKSCRIVERLLVDPGSQP